jgi:tRNA pseudouridine55 synthase
MEGILLVDKPVGWTSFDVVNLVRKTIAYAENLKPAKVKVGHIGTLDPLASGLLVLLIGKKYTKMAIELTKLDKKYIVQMKLGEITDSIDLESEPRFYSSIKPSKAQVIRSFQSFEGNIMQIPPAFSALKINGQRAYDLARKGKQVELKARPVTIYSIKLTNYEYPDVSFKASVSSGTYIRSLVLDIGSLLKSGAYMSGLQRTSVGDFKLKDSLKIDSVSFEKINSHLLFI